MKIKSVSLYRSLGGAACAGAVLLTASSAFAQNLFVGDYASQGILEFSPAGTKATFATGLNYPSGVAFDSSGNLFESDESSGNIYEWAGAGNTRTTFASGLGELGAIAFNAAGDLFVDVNGTAIDEFNSSGAVINTISGFSSASGLAFDSAGNLYVANLNGGGSGTGFISKITPKGVESTYASGLTYPNQIAFNAAGDMFVADGYGTTGNTTSGYDTITEITPGGSKSLFASGLNNPSSIAFDRTGDMFVADNGHSSGNGDITEFSANGTESVFASGFRPSGMAFQGATLPVPEPSVWSLGGLGFGVMGVVLACRRGRKTPSVKV
jgi:DNA-binding beta-propeller fold protein YncE